MSTAQLTLNIAHPSDKGLHQETLQWEFQIQEDGNWMQSFMDYVNKEEEKDDNNARNKNKSQPKIVT
jgi:hypothetical protein